MIVAAQHFAVSGEVLDATVRRIVGRKLRQLLRSRVIELQDAEDVEHDLLLRVLTCWPAFDPEQSHAYAFTTMVVERAVASMLRDRRAEKRDPARLERLASDVAYQSEDCAHVELAADVETVVAQLPHDLRSLAERLKRDSVSQVARDTNVPRTSVYHDVRKLRERFEAAGLDGGHNL